MSSHLDSEPNPAQRAIYQIRIKGHLRPEWTDWFGGMTITREDNGVTLLTGIVVDQSALYALLTKARDLAMPLLEVCRMTPDEP